MLAGRYALEEELGRSGTGMVWRAVDTVLERAVAIKLVHPALADDPAFAARLAEDVRKTAAASGPGLVRLLDSGGERGVSFLVCEHVPGESLRARLEREGALTSTDAAELGATIADALAAAHRAGVLHLAVKPENVLLDRDGRARLTDLGLGAAIRALRPAAEATILLAPTPEPPELATGNDPDERTDGFLAGALLFEALTGRAPSPGERSPRAVRPQVPWALDAAVVRALAPDPAERHTDLAALAAALREVEGEPATTATPHTVAHTLRSWLLVPALVALAAAVAIAVGVWLGRLELGGPLGVRPKDQPSSQAPVPLAETVLPFVAVSAFDPLGDGVENGSGAPLAIDGDGSTAWRSENYFDAELNKPGVGLLFDLGQSRSVTGFRLQVPHPGYTFGVAVGDDPDALVEAATAAYTAASTIREAIDPVEGRYVLLWITSVVDAGDGNRAEVAEFEVVGPDA